MNRNNRGTAVRMVVLAGVAFLTVGCASAGVAPGLDQAVPTSVPWRVVSYNIHHARGMDERVDLDRIAGVLRRLDADIIALQEVDEGVERSGREDQARRLGHLLGMHHAFGSFMDYQGGRYGMAILSRCAIRSIDPVRVTEGNEPRVALVVDVVQPDGSVLTVVNVHFDWVRDDSFRFAQATEVARLLDGLRGPWIVAGDFNDQPGSRTLDLFHARAREAAKPRDRRLTFSSTEPRREIDFVFASPAAAWNVESVEVVNESMASDHLPVIAEMELVTPQVRSTAAHAAACSAGAEVRRGEAKWN